MIMSKSLEQQLIAKNEQMRKIKNEQKQLRQKLRAESEKAKKQRLFNRGAYLERIAPHIAEMSESEYENYINKIISPEIILEPPPEDLQGGIFVGK
jgi:CYTH domain-containing protein